MDGGPQAMKCRYYDEWFDLTPDLHYVYNDDSTWVWCPCCLARGYMRPHLVMDTWLPGFEYREQAETATTEQAVAAP
jgi:hypothetical protein